MLITHWITNHKIILFLLLLASSALLLTFLTPNLSAGLSKKSEIKMSTWLWKSPKEMDESEFSQLVTFAKEKNIKVIHLFVEDYLSKTTNIDDFNQKIKNFISIANNSGIEIEALAGSVDWSEPENENLPLTLLDRILEFNAQNYPEKFSGVQFDVEFYNQENFTKDKIKYTENYLKLVTKLSNKAKETNDNKFKLGFAISHGLDTGKGRVPKIEFNGTYSSVYEHLLKILKDTSSYLVIMAYRNNPVGNNSSSSISKDEIELADQIKSNVEIYIGQETEKNELEYITFYDTSRNQVEEAINIIADTFKNSQSFKGISIHTLEGYKNLKQK